ncbi:MAG: hypothetical protein V4673_18530 [Pseudomonadota bacterium]
MPTIPARPATQASSGMESDAGCIEALRVAWVGITALTPPTRSYLWRRRMPKKNQAQKALDFFRAI